MNTEVPASLADVLAAPPTPQRPFPWKPDGWRAEMHDLPDVLTILDSLPDRVDRTTVRDTVLAELENRRVLPAFVAAMVWGYGDAGYGATRVRWVLTGVKNGARSASVRGDVPGLLGDAVHVVRADGPVEGFRYMANAGRIKHLASAFFTKWLYFSSALSNPDDSRAAPILDKRVNDWLRTNAHMTLDISRTADYRRYLDVLTHWGDGYAVLPSRLKRRSLGWPRAEPDTR